MTPTATASPAVERKSSWSFTSAESVEHDYRELASLNVLDRVQLLSESWRQRLCFWHELPNRHTDLPSVSTGLSYCPSDWLETTVSFRGTWADWAGTIHPLLDADVWKQIASLAERLIFDTALPEVSPEVAEFLLEHSLVSDFFGFARLAKRCFSEAISLSASRMYNPEEEDSEWIALELCVEGDVDEILQQYDSFVGRTIEDIPPRSRAFFRLSLDIL